MYSFGNGPEAVRLRSLRWTTPDFADLANASAALDQLDAHFAESGLPPLEYSNPSTGILQANDVRVTSGRSLMARTTFS
ncbi:MAG: hypothetical protein BMS9Abin07_1817 [Acidimicrobiia bacterium]|nr:MAG: hypothetical protein BMS9Abin07_1817 [Acidimicrobiia bacterium]